MGTRTMYDIGYDHGHSDAVYCCLGKEDHGTPDFDTPDEERDYFDGYEAGYGSVD